MKTSTQTQHNGLAALATCCAIALGTGSSGAMAFVDYDHSAEGVKHSATSTVIQGHTGPKPGGFVDYDHSAEGVDPNAPANNSGRSIATGGFVDWDHSAESIRS